MRTIYSIVFLLITHSFIGNAQTKNFIDQPFIETRAKVDTLVTPDKIYLTIIITEKDTKGKTSVEELENLMAKKLISLGVDLDKQLSLSDVSSNFKKYFLKRQDILKSKSFTLIVYNGLMAGKVMVALESNNISNVYLEKMEYSKMNELELILKGRAIKKAHKNASIMSNPLNQQVGKALFISDLGNNMNYYNAKSNKIRIRGVSAMNDESFNPIDIDFEKIKVESQVLVKFKLE